MEISNPLLGKLSLGNSGKHRITNLSLINKGALFGFHLLFNVNGRHPQGSVLEKTKELE